MCLVQNRCLSWRKTPPHFLPHYPLLEICFCRPSEFTFLNLYPSTRKQKHWLETYWCLTHYSSLSLHPCGSWLGPGFLTTKLSCLCPTRNLEYQAPGREVIALLSYPGHSGAQTTSPQQGAATFSFEKCIITLLHYHYMRCAK
jgi:hypothetical protein